MLAAAVHLMRGTPYIYQGEEIGMTNPHFNSLSQYRDVESLNYYQILLGRGKSEEEALSILAARSRDNSRTPMQWSGEAWGDLPKEPLGSIWQTITAGSMQRGRWRTRIRCILSIKS